MEGQLWKVEDLTRLPKLISDHNYHKGTSIQRVMQKEGFMSSSSRKFSYHNAHILLFFLQFMFVSFKDILCIIKWKMKCYCLWFTMQSIVQWNEKSFELLRFLKDSTKSLFCCKTLGMVLNINKYVLVKFDRNSSTKLYLKVLNYLFIRNHFILQSKRDVYWN